MDTDSGHTTQTAQIARGPLEAGAGGTTARRPAQERFGPLLAEFRARFEARLSAWLAARRRAVEAELPEALPLVDAAAGLATAGGKRLRPALVWFSHLACGGLATAPGADRATPSAGGAASGRGEAAFAIGVAVELFHAYLLVHDDVMDHSAVRRGEPAAHERFAALHRERGWSGDADDFGRSAAILVGDLAHTWAAELFTAGAGNAGPRGGGQPGGRLDGGHPVGHTAGDAGQRAELERIFAALSAEVIGGQLLELRLAAQGRASEDDLLRVLRLKSGRYSVERPIELGAVLAGAPPATRTALARYGRALGEAFQLQDDVLGLFGDAGAVGKPVGGDLAGGKYTYLVHLALERLDPARAARLRDALGRDDLAPAEAAAAAEAIRDSGALDRVREMIDERLDEARAALESAFGAGSAAAGDPRDGTAADGRDFLAGLIDGLGSRRR